jgi:uncharacterized protein YbaP (TraB family)
MRRIFLLVIFVFSILLSFSQSVLWKVSGKNIKEPSFLYGTIHIQDKRVFSFDETVINAFNSTQSFAMEILMDEIPVETLNEATLMKNNSLDKLLTPEEYNIADSIVKKKLGMGLVMFKRMKPFFLLGAIMQADFTKDMELALDLYFLNMAREQDKPCYEVEKFMHQMNAIDVMSEKEQASLFFSAITDTASVMQSEIEELISCYLKFELERISTLLSEVDVIMKDFGKNFIVKRNKVMVSTFLKITEKQSCFCAIGAGHLPGKHGLIELLRKKGYTVEPVIFNWVE